MYTDMYIYIYIYIYVCLYPSASISGLTLRADLGGDIREVEHGRMGVILGPQEVTGIYIYIFIYIYTHIYIYIYRDAARTRNGRRIQDARRG